MTKTVSLDKKQAQPAEIRWVYSRFPAVSYIMGAGA